MAVTETEHAITPRLDTAYSMKGANTGLPANLLNPFHYPVEAVCEECGQMIRCEHFYSSDGGWEHLGRMPGEQM